MVGINSAQAPLSSNEIAHLEMVESIITRMAQNSFALKGWAITLLVAICSLSAAGSEKRFLFVAILPLVVFWILDSFYLQKERKFRALYNMIIARGVPSFSMDISEINTPKTKYIHCLFSVTEWFFYLSCLMGTAAVVLLLFLV